MTELKIKSDKLLKSVSSLQERLVIKSAKESKKQDDRFYATGKRKNAIARVWLKPGKGKFTVNKKEAGQYFLSDIHVKTILQPFFATRTDGLYDVLCTVKGGGISGQKGAILHGISKALDQVSSEFRPVLRKKGFLTRDSRVVERKKYGQRKARKKVQFSKR